MTQAMSRVHMRGEGAHMTMKVGVGEEDGLLVGEGLVLRCGGHVRACAPMKQ